MNAPRPNHDTGIGAHSDPNAYYKPPNFQGYADDLWDHGIRWWLSWFFDENKRDFIRVMRQRGIEVIGRPGPAKMPRPNIDIAHIEAYIGVGVRYFVLGNEYNLHEEWDTPDNWKGFDKPVRHVADWYVRMADEVRRRGAWPLTPPPSLGGHINHREWFVRFMTALQNIAAERGVSMESLLYPGGIGLHCRSVGNPLADGPEDYDCSAREWEWFDNVVKSFVGRSLPMANTEAFDEPQWLPQVGGNYDWDLWQMRNLEQFLWFAPDNGGYRYPEHMLCNCFWLIHADKFSPWPQCGLVSNYPHFVQRGDYITDLWKAMPGFISWNRDSGVEPTPPPPPPPPPPEVEFVGLSEEMITALSITPAPELSKPHWKVTRVEVQPQTDNQSAFVILPTNYSGRVSFYWPGASSPFTPMPKVDAYAPSGAQEWAASMPMFNPWGSYGVEVFGDAGENSEQIFGFGLFEPEHPEYTGHHPTLITFRLVEPAEPEPEPPPPPPPPYKFVDGLNQRLEAAGLAYVVDMRSQIEEKYVDVGLMERSYKRSLGPESLWSIFFHHTGVTTPLNVMAMADYHINTKGWPNIAPHFCIDGGGTVWFTKKLAYHGPQCGQNIGNLHGISIEVNGNFTEEAPTLAQLKALECLVMSLEEFVGGGWGAFHPLPIIRHKDVTATACPGSLYEDYRRFLAK